MRCRDLILSAHGYRRLQSGFAAHSKEDESTVEEVAFAKARLLCQLDNGDLHCSHWRFLAVTDLALPSSKAHLNSGVIDERPDNLRLFSHEAAIRTWKKCLEFVPEKEALSYLDQRTELRLL